jgi:K+-transporting ATPase KdpF subunit
MSFELWAGALLAAGLFIYFLAALARPDRF